MLGPGGCRRVAEPRPDGDEFVQPFTLPLPEYVKHLLGGQYTDADMGLAGLVGAGLLTPGPGLR
ncbi:hypothetical protein [Streptomyces clavuligerus]|uniref:hypothetical protein n=1 Tax=Streptomyces clavuligerus TaxID=1901 RepID=UPI00020D9206|nr:hypothetical protein [Streptomyces clavuligerus]WDN55927.1 hypothetical protein LL058_28950 [Streptomyces clavuligerus]